MQQVKTEQHEQAVAQAIGNAWYRGKQQAIQGLRYDNRFIATPLKRAYAAGFVSTQAMISAIRERANKVGVH